MLHLVQSLSIAVMVEWSGPHAVYNCGGQALCSALGIGTVLCTRGEEVMEFM